MDLSGEVSADEIEPGRPIHEMTPVRVRQRHPSPATASGALGGVDGAWSRGEERRVDEVGGGEL